MYYIYMTLVQDDVEAQRKGIVEIFYNVGNTNPIYLPHVTASQRLHSALPVKVAANHACSDDPIVRTMFQICRPFFSLERLSRMRIHMGKFTAFCADGVSITSLVMSSSLLYLRFCFVLHMSKKGGHLEVQYELLSYGIPLAALPVNADGVGSRAYNCRWLQERRELEKQQRLMETASTAMVTSTTADSQKPTTVTNYTDVVPSSTSTSGEVARRFSNL